MVSSARKAPSPMVVILGISRTVEASTFLPTLGSEQAQPGGVKRLA